MKSNTLDFATSDGGSLLFVTTRNFFINDVKAKVFCHCHTDANRKSSKKGEFRGGAYRQPGCAFIAEETEVNCVIYVLTCPLLNTGLPNFTLISMVDILNN